MSNRGAPISRVVVVGDGYLVYLVALAVKLSLPVQAQVQVFELHGKPSTSTAVSASGQLRALHRSLRINESDFLADAHALPNLGLRVGGAESPTSNFMLCDSEYGFLLRGRSFNKLFAHFQKRHPGVQLDDFCLQAVIAKNGRFVSGSNDPKSLFSLINYGYAFDASCYGAFLRKLALERDIDVRCGKFESVLSEDQEIRLIRSADGETFQADLYLDCSAEGIVANVLSMSWVDLDKFIPRVRTQFHEVESESVQPYTDLICNNSSWRKRFNLAHATFEEHWQMSENVQPRFRGTPWVGNCIALADAALQVPLAILDQPYLMQMCLRRLLALWPSFDTFSACRKAFNRISDESMWRVVDVENLFFCRTSQTVMLTAANEHRLNLFREAGRLPRYEHEVVNEGIWTALFYALGIRENNFEELNSEFDWIDVELTRILSTFRAAANDAPRFDAVLEQITRR